MTGGEPMRMPWGKHKGEKVEDLPTDYLEWCLSNIEGNDALLREMQNQLDMRAGGGVVR